MRLLAPLPLLLVARLALGLAYSAVIPPWEGVDEEAHFAYAQYLAAHGRVPRPGDPDAERILEKHQPPAYYLLMAVVIEAVGASEPPVAVARNPYLAFGGGYNYAVQPLAPSGAYRAALVALYAARWATTLLATASALAVYGAARRLWPRQPAPALAATALYAFWPQYLYLSSVVNNDALVTAIAAVLLFAAVRVALDGPTLSWTLILLGSFGAALLTKLNGLALAAPLVLAVLGGLARAISQRRQRAWLAWSGLAVVLGGVLLALSQLEFVSRHALGLGGFRWLVTIASATGRLDFWFLLPGLGHALRSFLGEFGWGNLVLPAWLYAAWGAGLAVAIVGLFDSAFEPRVRLPGRVLALLLGQVLAAGALAAAVAVSAADTYLLLGRYMLPALPAVAVLWAAGSLGLWPRRWRQAPTRALTVAAVLTGWCVPWLTLAPAYARPQPLPPGAPIAHPLALTYDDVIELAGYQPVTPALGQASVTLCWRALRPTSKNYTILVEALAADSQVLGTLATYPGNGNYATSLWRAPEVFCEPYRVSAHAASRPALPAAVRISVLSDPDRLPVSPRNATGDAGPLAVHIPLP